MQLPVVQTVPEIQVRASQGTDQFILMVAIGERGNEALRAASNHICSIKKISKLSYIFPSTSLKLVC